MRGMDPYYESFTKQILARRDQIRSLTRQSKIQGDYYEALVREFIRKHIPKRYSVGHGLVFDEREQKRSKECDVIVYDSSKRQPLFQSQDLVIVNPDDV